MTWSSGSSVPKGRTVCGSPTSRGGRLGLLLRGDGRVELSGRGLADRRAHPHRTRGQGQPVHELAVRASAAGGRAARVDGPGCLEPGQRGDGIVLVADAARVAGPTLMAVEAGPHLGHVRVDRGLVQPPATALRDRDVVTPRVRNPSQRRCRGGMVQPTTTVRETGSSARSPSPPVSRTPAPKPRTPRSSTSNTPDAATATTPTTKPISCYATPTRHSNTT